MTAVDRILEILKDTGLSTRKFELSIDKTSGYLNSLVKRGSSPSVDVVSKIIEVYPHYSGEWIVSGVGSMIRRGDPDRLIKKNNNCSRDVSVDEIIDSKIESKLSDLKKSIIQIIISEIDDEISGVKNSTTNRQGD